MERCGYLYIHNVGMIEPEMLRNLEAAIAPSERKFRGGLEGIRIAGHLIESVVRSLGSLRIVQHQRKRPAACVLRGLLVNQVKSLLWLRVVFIILELPAFHYRAAIGEFHPVESVFDNNGALLRFRGRLC